MRKKKFKWGKYGLIGLVFVLISYLGKIAIYPCKSSPVIAVPKYTWKLCNMDILGRLNWVGVSEKYLGFYQGKWIALLLNLVIAYLIVYLLIYIHKKKVKK